MSHVLAEDGHRVGSTLAVLAGDRYREARIAGQANKALLTFGGRTSLERVLEAVVRSAVVDEVIVVGPPALDHAIAAVDAATPMRRVEQGTSLVDNIGRAFAAAQIVGARRLVFATADIPLVQPKEIERFVELVRASPADACIAIACPMQSPLSATLQGPYRRSMIVARGGPYLLGNLFALRSTVLEFAEVILRGRRLRKQSRMGNVARAFATLARMGIRAGPALAIWLRLVIARTLWLYRGDDLKIPAIAPDTDGIAAAMMALVSGGITVEFTDIGPEGACFDIDHVGQYEAVRQMVHAV